MPKTWKAYAGQVLGDSNAPMTPENQNKVAYTKIDSWLKSGYTPAQAASMWNAGEHAPNAWKKGTVQKVGNTPLYVKNVQKYAQELSTGLPRSVQPNQAQATNQQNNLPKAVMPQSAPATQTQLPKPTGGLLGTIEGIGKGAYGILQGLEKPFLNVGAIPVQLLAKALGKPDPFAGGIPNVVSSGGISPVGLSGTNLEKKAGSLAQAGSYFVPGTGALGAVGMGGLQLGGQAMSQGAGAGTVLAETALGAGLGGATAGISRLAGYGLQKLGNGLTGAETSKALTGMKNAYTKILNFGVREKRIQKATGQDIAKILVDHQAPLGRNADGTLDTTDAITKLQDALAPLNDNATNLLKEASNKTNKSISLPDILKNVESEINKAKATAEEKALMSTRANKAINAEVQANGKYVTPEVSDTIKSAFWNKTFASKMPTSSEKLHNDVSYMIGNELRNAEEKAVQGTGTSNVLKSINKNRSGLINAIKMLQDANGVKLLRGGRMGGLFSGLAGAVIGTHTGGVLGGVTGDFLGTKASEFLNNPATRLAIERAKLQTGQKAMGLLGRTAKPLGRLSTRVGKGLSLGARGVGLLSTTGVNRKQ